MVKILADDGVVEASTSLLSAWFIIDQARKQLLPMATPTLEKALTPSLATPRSSRRKRYIHTIHDPPLIHDSNTTAPTTDSYQPQPRRAMFGDKKKAAAAKAAAAAASSTSALWGYCDAAMPPLVTSPLRAILWCLALTFLPHFLRVRMVLKLKGRYNNLMPRTHQVNKNDNKEQPDLVKMIQRATAAHANSWEAFAYFSFSCLTAHVLKLDAQVASSLCTLFLVLRFAYVLLYIVGTSEWIGVVRSLVWVGALVASVRLSVLALARAGL